jgi:hypothetical protein
MFAASVMVALFSIARASSGPFSVGVGAADTQATKRAVAAAVNFMMGEWKVKNKMPVWYENVMLSEVCCQSVVPLSIFVLGRD